MASHEAYRATTHFASLDGWRALSILAVLYHHAGTPVDWLPATERGFLGVDMFFLLSGFLIVTLLRREQERTGQIALKKFYLRRTLRIFPIYYGLLTGLSLLYVVLGDRLGSGQGFFAALPFYLTYTSNWLVGSRQAANLAITWSLSAEEQFYLLWPTLEKFLRPRKIVLLLMTMLLLNQLVNFGLLGEHIRGWQRELIMLQITFTPIFLGVLLAHVLHHERSFAWLARIAGQPWFAPWALLVFALECHSFPADIQGWPRLVMQLTLWLLLASTVIRADHGLRWLLNNRLMRFWGTMSYGMYLYHLWALFIADQLLAGRPALADTRVLICLLLTTIMAVFSYRFIERPCLRLKDRWR